jgi:lysozyme
MQQKTLLARIPKPAILHAMKTPKELESGPVAVTKSRLFMLVKIWTLITPGLFALMLWAPVSKSAEFSEPWKDPNIAIAIDPYEGNDIDWDQLGTDRRVVAIIHRATIGFRADRKYAERRVEAKRRGYKWGAYHLGRPGDPIKQADFFLAIVRPKKEDLLALDLGSTDARDMSLAEAAVFIKRIKQVTGRYPLVYANDLVTRAINNQHGGAGVFANTRLWYARFKGKITDFPAGTWKTYTLWQFSSELNCRPGNRGACLYTVPGTEYDMDIDVFNGNLETLKRHWPLL